MKTIQLTQNQVALVDDEDYDYLNQWKWCVIKNKKGYYAIRATGPRKHRKYIFMHLFIMNTPSNLQVDHIDHNGLNNQKYNLRNCTAQENQRNSTARGSSKYRGVSVYWENGIKRIKAAIAINGKTLHLGLFKTEEDAALVYDKAVKVYYGEFANPNFK